MQQVPGVTPIESANMFQSYRKQMNGLLQTILVIMGITWVLSVLLIGLVFSMAANERRKELGVLRALGATRLHVFQVSCWRNPACWRCSVEPAASLLAALAIYLFRKLIMVSLDIPFLLPSPGSLLLQIGAGLLLALISVNLAALVPGLQNQPPGPGHRHERVNTMIKLNDVTKIYPLGKGNSVTGCARREPGDQAG